MHKIYSLSLKVKTISPLVGGVLTEHFLRLKAGLINKQCHPLL